MVPKGWKVTTLGDISILITSGSRDWAKYYSDKGDLFIRMTNLNRSGIQLILDDLKYVDINTSQSSDGKRASLEYGDVLISITAELGKIGWVPYNLGTAFINQHIALVRTNSQISNSKFIAYKLSSDSVNKMINSLNDSGAKAGLNLSTIRTMPLMTPPLPEQKKIAQILSTWDSAVSVTEKLIINSQQQKKALMQQLLTGKKRLLDEDGVKFSGEWEKGKLGDIANIDTGYAFKSNDFTESASGVPIIRMSDFKTGQLDTSNAARVDRDCIAGLERFRLKVGDFVFGMSGSLNNYGQVRKENLPCYLNQRVGRLVAKGNASQRFIAYIYLSELIQKEIIDKAAGAAQLNISASDLRSIKIFFPSMKEQQKIAAVLSAADAEISTLEKKLACLKDEKKALMQQLLTGKRRVTVDADAA